jgi:hypothetical protein
MWGHLGDAAGDIAGSYYYERAQHVNHFWNLFDQVLIRPELARRFETSQLRIVKSIGSQSLVRQDGTPDSRFSDHLPIVFELGFQLRSLQMAAQTDLWGDIQAEAIRTPVSILREQATLLGPKTQNLIEAKVATTTELGTFFHSFNLVVPAQDSYTYRLFRISRQIELHPIRVHGDPIVDLANEGAFRDWLRQRLSSEETRRIIASLTAQASG